MIQELSAGEVLFNEYRDKATKEFLDTEKLWNRIKDLEDGGSIHQAAELMGPYDRRVNITMMHIAMAELHRPRGN
jgi:hypothetical protein